MSQGLETEMFQKEKSPGLDRNQQVITASVRKTATEAISMGAGTGGAGWASAHPGKNQGGHGPPW